MKKMGNGMMFDIEAESSVLAACMLNEEYAKETIPKLDKKLFVNLTNQSICVAMKALVEKNRPVDQITIRDYLASKGSKVECSDIIRLGENTFSLTSCRYHLEILQKLSLQRDLINAATMILAMAQDPQEDIESVRTQTLEIINSLVDAGK